MTNVFEDRKPTDFTQQWVVNFDELASRLDDILEGQRTLGLAQPTLTNHADTTKVVLLGATTTPGAGITRANGIFPPKNNLLAQYDVCGFQLNVTAAATEAGDTLDVYVDGSYDPTWAVWFNIGHFTQALGNGGALQRVAQITHPTAAVADVLTTADAASGVWRNLWAPHIRVGYVGVDANVNTNAVFSFNVIAYLQAK